MNYAIRHPRRTLGLTRAAPSQAWLWISGEENLPRGRFGLSSAKVFTPRLSAATWGGRQAVKRKVPILNLFNRTPTPVVDGFSVRVTQVEDFRGKKLTYDSHNGTDFVIPPGTDVVAVAKGRVASIRNEYNRGGLKVFVDHGHGLISTYHHLSESKVAIGDAVEAGQAVAISGYSGIDALASLGAVPPHVHFNAILGGVLVDPFAQGSEESLWVGDDNLPHALPGNSRKDDDKFTPTNFDPKKVLALHDSMVGRKRQLELAKYRNEPNRLAVELIIDATTYPTRFSSETAGSDLYDDNCERTPRMHLPFSLVDYDTSVFSDDAGFRYTLFKG